MKTDRVTTDPIKGSTFKNSDNVSAADDLSCALFADDTCGSAHPGQALVMTKWIGIYGSVWMAENRYDELRTRYPDFIMEDAKDLKQFLNIGEDIKIAHEHGDTCVHACGDGGLYGALWDIVKASDVGMTANFKDIPIRQETVELCEFYDINPYKLKSDGAVIVATSSPNELIEMYAEAGIPAAVIGYITEDRERVIIYNEEKKHIQKPARDELYKIM